jgi:hypothetical protein
VNESKVKRLRWSYRISLVSSAVVVLASSIGVVTATERTGQVLFTILMILGAIGTFSSMFMLKQLQKRLRNPSIG